MVSLLGAKCITSERPRERRPPWLATRAFRLASEKPVNKPKWWAGRESTPDSHPIAPKAGVLGTPVCIFGRCRVVRLHYPPFWNSRRESNPDLFLRKQG